RTVIDDDNFKISIALTKNAFYGLRHIGPAVISGNKNAHLWSAMREFRHFFNLRESPRLGKDKRAHTHPNCIFSDTVTGLRLPNVVEAPHFEPGDPKSGS